VLGFENAGRLAVFAKPHWREHHLTGLQSLNSIQVFQHCAVQTDVSSSDSDYFIRIKINITLILETSSWLPSALRPPELNVRHHDNWPHAAGPKLDILAISYFVQPIDRRLGCFATLRRRAAVRENPPINIDYDDRVFVVTAEGANPRALRASVIAYFFLLDLTGLLFLTREGLVGRESLSLAAVCLPVLAAGMWLGGRHFLGATPSGFRRATLVLLVLLALLGIVRALST
jgi:hypothetical protein